jgi:hypothetical protein
MPRVNGPWAVDVAGSNARILCIATSGLCTGLLLGFDKEWKARTLYAIDKSLDNTQQPFMTWNHSGTRYGRWLQQTCVEMSRRSELRPFSGLRLSTATSTTRLLGNDRAAWGPSPYSLANAGSLVYKYHVWSDDGILKQGKAREFTA